MTSLSEAGKGSSPTPRYFGLSKPVATGAPSRWGKRLKVVSA